MLWPYECPHAVAREAFTKRDPLGRASIRHRAPRLMLSLVLPAIMALLLSGCGDGLTAPPPPPPLVPQAGYVFASAYPTVDSALRVVEAYGGTLDLGGRGAVMALQIRASKSYAGHEPPSRFQVTREGIMASEQAMDAAVLCGCMVLGSGIGETGRTAFDEAELSAALDAAFPVMLREKVEAMTPKELLNLAAEGNDQYGYGGQGEAEDFRAALLKALDSLSKKLGGGGG